MSLKSILFEEECNRCAPFGVMCTQRGFFTEDQNNPAGKSVIHNDGRGFVCQEPIDQCPVVLDEITSKQMSKELRPIIKEVRPYVVPPEIKKRPSKPVFIFRF